MLFPDHIESEDNARRVERRVEQLRAIMGFLRAACRNSADPETFRDTLRKLASPEEGIENRHAAAVFFTGLWRTKVNPSELFIDFEALHLLFEADPSLDPYGFLRAMENASDAVLELYDTHRYEPINIRKLYQQLNSL
jgi:hypothetical protein